jgi:hypothetical protein
LLILVIVKELKGRRVEGFGEEVEEFKMSTVEGCKS